MKTFGPQAVVMMNQRASVSSLGYGWLRNAMGQGRSLHWSEDLSLIKSLMAVSI